MLYEDACIHAYIHPWQYTVKINLLSSVRSLRMRATKGVHTHTCRSARRGTLQCFRRHRFTAVFLPRASRSLDVQVLTHAYGAFLNNSNNIEKEKERERLMFDENRLKRTVFNTSHVCTCIVVMNCTHDNKKQKLHLKFQSPSPPRPRPATQCNATGCMHARVHGVVIAAVFTLCARHFVTNAVSQPSAPPRVGAREGGILCYRVR